MPRSARAVSRPGPAASAPAGELLDALVAAVKRRRATEDPELFAAYKTRSRPTPGRWRPPTSKEIVLLAADVIRDGVKEGGVPARRPCGERARHPHRDLEVPPPRPLGRVGREEPRPPVRGRVEAKAGCRGSRGGRGGASGFAKPFGLAGRLRRGLRFAKPSAWSARLRRGLEGNTKELQARASPARTDVARPPPRPIGVGSSPEGENGAREPPPPGSPPPRWGRGEREGVTGTAPRARLQGPSIHQRAGDVFDRRGGPRDRSVALRSSTSVSTRDREAERRRPRRLRLTFPPPPSRGRGARGVGARERRSLC